MQEGARSKVDRLVGSLLEDPARARAFQQRIVASLREPWIHHQGQAVTLAAYLDARDGHGVDNRGGDEQPVVDLLGRRFLEALGYEGADIRYNAGMSAGRPDYVVHLTGSDVAAPVFVLEDKATNVRDLRKAQAGRAGDESPVDQLRRYTRSGRVRGNAGLLCNGWVLEAWQFSAEGDSRVVHLDVHALAKHAVAPGAEAPLPEALSTALCALWSRFSRASFVETLELRPVAPLPSEDWAERIRAAFQGGPKAGDEIVDQHYEAAWRVTALNVAVDQRHLVHTLRTLIDSFSYDVRHQLDDALARAAEYEAEIARVHLSSGLEELRKTLAGSWRRFDLTEDEFEQRVLRPVDQWLVSPKPGGVWRLRAAIRRELADHVIAKETKAPVQQKLLGDTAPEVSAGAPTETKRKEALDLVDDLVRKLCTEAVSTRAERARLETESRPSVEALRAFSSWVDRVSASVMVGADNDALRAEFARQTAYVYIVRLVLVRICEDKGLFQRKLSDGGLTRWEELSARFLDYASGRSYEYLTQMAYECAQNVYVHFYGASRIFDWYHMDEKMLLRAIMALNNFDLQHIDTDIIGTVYGQYLEEGKHEQGRYFTPGPLVRVMLDTMGYRGGRIIGRRLGDLACGSGSFLVEACRRLLDRYKGQGDRVPSDKIEAALEEVQRSFFGMDINPFACYLAETNLLIQVLDLVRRAQEEGLSFTVNRFAIYTTDSLLVNRDLTDLPGAEKALFEEDLVPELVKARAGEFKDGFDFLIGNPPYVRADERAEHYLEYRRRLESEAWFQTRHLKWDLYVPFVEQYRRLLSDDPDARACLITIESLATAPYAEKLRELLARRSTLHDVSFVEGLGLFTDASWQDNVVFCFSCGAPPEGHQVARRIARSRHADGSLALEPLDVVTQAEADPGRLFNKRPQVNLNLKNTVRWDELCYVSKGMVLHSSEKLADESVVHVPASYDPSVFGEQLVKDMGRKGKSIRHKAFGREALVAAHQDAIHTRKFVSSRAILHGGVGAVEWLEYGAHTRCPARVSRPTFPELYAQPKIMFGKFTGVAVDVGPDDFLTTSDAVRIAVRWTLLRDVGNRAVNDERNRLREERRYDPSLSDQLSEWYLCALALSAPIQGWLASRSRSMKDDVYPEDIRAIPVKRISADAQAPYIALAKERHQLWAEITALVAEGYEIGQFNDKARRFGGKVEVPVHRLAEQYRKEHPKARHLTLAQAIAAGLFRVEDHALSMSLRGARAAGAALLVKKQKVAEVGEDIQNKAEVAKVLARLFSALPATFAERQGIDKIPATEEGILDLAAWLDAKRAEVEAKQRRIEAIGAEIDEMAWALYKPRAQKTRNEAPRPPALRR